MNVYQRTVKGQEHKTLFPLPFSSSMGLTVSETAVYRKLWQPFLETPVNKDNLLQQDLLAKRYKGKGLGVYHAFTVS